MSAPQKTKLAEELLRRFAAALRAVQLYASTHPLVARSIAALNEALALAHGSAASIAIGMVGEELVVGDIPVPRAAESMGKLVQQLQEAGIERIVIDRGVPESELTQLVQTLGASNPREATTALARLRHIRVGRLQVEQRAEAPASTTTRCRSPRRSGTAPRPKASPTPTRAARSWTRSRRRCRRTAPRSSR